MCGRFFIPHKNVGSRQQICLKDRCKKSFKRLNQKKWHDKNQDYFKGRYEYVKSWRAKNSKYQSYQRRKNKCEIQDLVVKNSLEILMGFAIVAHFAKVEIQDLVRHSFCCCSGFYRDG
jgi:hypothetical protein